jgi:hypothetical protein
LDLYPGLLIALTGSSDENKYVAEAGDITSTNNVNIAAACGRKFLSFLILYITNAVIKINIR